MTICRPAARLRKIAELQRRIDTLETAARDGGRSAAMPGGPEVRLERLEQRLARLESRLDALAGLVDERLDRKP